MRKQSNSKIMMRNKYLYFHICNLEVLLDISDKLWHHNLHTYYLLYYMPNDYMY